MNNTFVVDAVRACIGEVYLVGGAVRDTLRGESDKIKDYDFTTPLPIEEVVNKLEENGYKVIKSSVKYGTASTTIGQVKVEISTFRTEEYDAQATRTPTRVVFHNSIEEDLIRRDFTINAIAHDGEKYIDPYGGQNDIISEKIRAVGNAISRFEEDPLRMLRALRFVSELGFTLSNDTYEGITQSTELIKVISPDRLFFEFTKILSGDHWVRALSLGIETGLLENLLKTEFNEEFIDQFLTNLEKNKISSNEKVNRWYDFLDSLIHAWSKSHRSMTLGKTLTEFHEKFRNIFNWSNSLSNSLYDKLSDSFAGEDLSNLEVEYESLIEEGNPRQHLVLEKILRLQIRQAVNDRAFDTASKLAVKMIKEQNFNLQKRLENVDKRGEIIKEHKEFLLDTIRYVYLKYIEKNGYIETEKELNKLFMELLSKKDTFDLLAIEIGTEDRKRIIEESIIITNRILSGRLTKLTNAQILDKNKHIKRSQERLLRIRNSYLRELVELRKPPYSDDVIEKRTIYNFEVARICLELSNGEETAEYYSHMIDHYKWKTLMSTDIDSFYEDFDKMNQYLDLIEKDPKFMESFSYEGQYLYTAQCLTYAVTLVNDIDEKMDLVRNIVANYTLVSNRAHSKRNAKRYQLLLDWLSVSKELLKEDYANSNAVLLKLPLLKSYHYKDADEEFVLEKLPEIDKVRSQFYDLEAFLIKINDLETELDIRNENLEALILLRNQKFIDNDLIYEIFKNVLSSLVNESVPLEPISFIRDTSIVITEEPISEILELIKQGESENVEFKESWRYSVKDKKLDPEGHVLESAIRTIAAFMNTDGGTLLLGVRDSDQEIMGLEESDFIQFRKKAKNQLGFQDSLRKIIDDKLRQKIGSPALTLIKVDFEVFDGKTICSVKVRPSSSDVFFNDKYYVRHTASTVELSIKDYSAYKNMKATT